MHCGGGEDRGDEVKEGLKVALLYSVHIRVYNWYSLFSLLHVDAPRGGQEHRTFPNWLVCLALSQSSRSSGKLLEGKRV